ncbi:MAG: DEAD/DEAH box helicase [Bacilli bacterium]
MVNNNVNCLLFDYIDGYFVCFKHTEFDVQDEKNIYYKLRVKNYIKRFIKYFTMTEIRFKYEINYIDILNVINIFKGYGLNRNFEINISDELRKYLDFKNMLIEERNKIGIDIKNKEEYLFEDFTEFKILLDSEMKRKLRDEQLWNAFHIVNMIKSANFSVPGAGKTSIVYGAYAYLNSKSVNKINKIVMIGPKNAFLAWKDEFVENFGDKKQLKVLDIHDKSTYDSNLTRYLKLESGKNNLILVNYESLLSIKDKLKEIVDEKTLLVFDEIHRIKSVTSSRANAAFEISTQAKYKVALTGTPIPNGYADLYNLLNILYADEYKMFFNKQIKDLKNMDEEAQIEFNKKIFPFFCRTTKRMLSIPQPNSDSIIEANMNSYEEHLFKLIYDKYSKNILTLYIRLLQASTNPQLLLKALDKKQIKDFFYENELDDDMENMEIDIENYVNENIVTESISNENNALINKCLMSSKFLVGIELIKKLYIEKKQILVWGIFNDTLYNIQNECTKLGIKSNIINGTVDCKEREKIINAFKNKEFSILIANPQTLAESVSLHKTCHDAIYFEYSFNLAHMVQSRDRINRLGLNDTQYTQYYYLRLNNVHDIFNSIDKKVYDRLKEKENIMINAVEGTTLKRVIFNDIEDLKLILANIKK